MPLPHFLALLAFVIAAAGLTVWLVFTFAPGVSVAFLSVVAMLAYAGVWYAKR